LLFHQDRDPSLTDFDDEERVVVVAAAERGTTLIIINIHSGDCLSRLSSLRYVYIYCVRSVANKLFSSLFFGLMLARSSRAISQKIRLLSGPASSSFFLSAWWFYYYYYYYDYYSPFLFLFLISVQRASW
jgi:hypothetical protein